MEHFSVWSRHGHCNANYRTIRESLREREIDVEQINKMYDLRLISTSYAAIPLAISLSALLSSRDPAKHWVCLTALDSANLGARNLFICQNANGFSTVYHIFPSTTVLTSRAESRDNGRGDREGGGVKPK